MEVLSLLTGILLVCSLGKLIGTRAQLSTGLLLLANWIACSGLARAAPEDPHLWIGYMTIDYLTGLLIAVGLGLVLRRRSRFAWAIVGVFGLQIIIHAARGMSADPVSAATRYWYWWALYDTAWIEVGLALAWIGYDQYRRIRADRARHGLSPDLAGVSRAAQGQPIV